MADLTNWDELLKKVQQLGFVVLVHDKPNGKEQERIVAAHRQLKLALCADSYSSSKSRPGVTNKVTVYGCVHIDQAVAFNNILEKYQLGASRGPQPNDRYDFSLQASGMKPGELFAALEELNRKLTFLDWKGVVKCYGIKDFDSIVKKSPGWVRRFTN